MVFSADNRVLIKVLRKAKVYGANRRISQQARFGGSSGVGVRLKVGDKYWEEWRGGVWGGAVPSPVEGLGACPRKKINFALKIMQFWASFGTILHSIRTYQRIRESGGLSPSPVQPSPKSGGPFPLPGRLWGEAAGACISQPDSWRWPAEVTPDRRVGKFPPGVHRWSDQAVASTSSSLHSSTRRTFWTKTLVMFDICIDVHFDSHMSAQLPIVDTFVLGVTSVTKPSITIASVDGFNLNLVICLQLDIALLIQNSVKIWHCLLELWQCIQGVTFFLDTVYMGDHTLDLEQRNGQLGGFKSDAKQ